MCPDDFIPLVLFYALIHAIIRMLKRESKVVVDADYAALLLQLLLHDTRNLDYSNIIYIYSCTCVHALRINYSEQYTPRAHGFTYEIISVPTEI